jgi:Class III cytochrome C family
MAALPVCAPAQNAFEELIEPGPLSEAHKKYESNCGNCHVSLKKEAQSSLCADCHKAIKQDIDRREGFHGKSELVKKSECVNCHAEHKGRDFKQALIIPLTFDHSATDYALDGKHANVECSACHKEGKKYSEAPNRCSGCHTDDPHRGSLGSDCQTCHSAADWKKIAAYDHSKTKFPLNGAHTKATCTACHTGEFYKGLASSCYECHAVQDVHEARFGRACNDCHSEKDWKYTRFDHGKFTRFALLGAHAASKCADCHGEKLTSKPPAACFDCHEKQDFHKGQLGKDCASCHKTTAWRDEVTFDHALTTFPLSGLHASVACESCHKTPAFKDAEKTCYGCHKKDDVHEGRFASKCQTCHTAMPWSTVTFDHDRDTKYKLTGKHIKVGCNGCHTQKNAPSAKIATDCLSCHRSQDVHRGSFGKDCGKCHSTSTFKSAVIRN